jgi:cAMP-binding proteins - catabolite gene activator and regulatory subunit of cAMP-dependent protein kinases
MSIRNREQLHKISKDCGLPEHFSFDIEPYIELKTFCRGEYICTEYEPLQSLYFLVNGRAKVSMTLSNGRVVLLHFCEGFTVIGEIECLQAQKSAQAVQAVNDCTCLVLPLDSLRERLQSDPRFLRFLCKTLSDKVTLNSTLLAETQSLKLEQRLAKYIVNTQDNLCFQDNLTEVSQFLGTSYRHLMRTLSGLCNNEVLKRQNKRFIITNLHALCILADN